MKRSHLKILFIGYANRVKSPMAEAIAAHLGGQGVKVQSGGIYPSESYAPETLQVLEEHGIEAPPHAPQHVDEVFACDAHRVVFLATTVPHDAFGTRIQTWDVPTPVESDLDAHRRAFADIHARVQALLAAEGVIAVPTRPEGNSSPPPSP